MILKLKNFLSSAVAELIIVTLVYVCLLGTDLLDNCYTRQPIYVIRYRILIDHSTYVLGSCANVGSTMTRKLNANNIQQYI